MKIDNVADIPDHVGASLGPTAWLPIGQDRVNAFAEATEDRQWIHIDPERAADSPFGQTIAHGFLTLSLVSHFLEQLLEVGNAAMLINYGLDKVRFPSPVPADGRVRATGTLAAATPVPGGYQLTVDIAIEAEGGTKPACVASWLVRVSEGG